MFRRLLLGLIDLYRKGISPFFPATCRFDPSCSAYARESVERFGVVRGGWLFLKRFARCHPFGGFGYDPVPTSSLGPSPAAPSDGRGDGPNTSTMDLRAR